jgi:hemolysin activation/secretion protein
MAPRPPAQIERQETPAQPPRERGGPRVLVKKFRFTGNTVISTQELETLVAPEEGKELTLDELREVAARITDQYASKGYILARAYLPPQDVREGIIEIAILEGQVGTIEVTGNERYRSEVITRALTRVKDRGVVNEDLLETAINDLNDYPGLNVRASLKPGAQRGYTDIQLTAQERLPYTLLFDVDNYGSRFTGPWLYGTELGIGNLAGLGDRLTLRGIKSDDDLNYGRVSYLVPVGGYGTKISASYVHSEDGIGEEFAPLNAAGRLDVASLDIIQPYLRTSGASLQFFGGFDFETVRNYALHTQTGKDDLRILKLGFSGDYRDRFLGRTFFGATWYQGTSLFGGNVQNDPGASRPDNPAYFSRWTLDLARLQSLVYGGSYLILRGTGQLSSQNLVSAERFAIGGYYTVRGYPISEYLGDNGYAVTAELVVPVPYLREWVQVVGFIDHGGVFLVSPRKEAPVDLTQHFLTGAGGGIRIHLPVPWVGGSLEIRVDYAVNVADPSPTSQKNGISQGKPGILYFASSIRF